MASSVETALEEAGKVVKRQKLCSSKVADGLDKLIALVNASRANLVAGDEAALSELQARAEQAGLLKDMNASTKELHKSINNLSKALEKAFDSQQDICKALRDVQFEQPLLNKVIAEHLYREGRFQLGDAFVHEAALPGGSGLKAPYVALHTVLQQIKRHDLGPALEWAVSHRAQLAPDGGPSGFEFKLHGLVFLNTLAADGQAAALAYAQRHFGQFRSRHMREIQRLMGCLLFADRPPSETPYADLLSPTHWDDVAVEFARQACSVLGQAVDSPLAVVVAAGSVSLPPLLKLAALMERGGQGPLSAVAQLPIEVELGHEFVFRSIFACPVSRDQSTPDNPPKLLPCNHVLCEQSILKIARSRSRVFKCPYCPMEARADNTRTLVFPDVE